MNNLYLNLNNYVSLYYFKTLLELYNKFIKYIVYLFN